VVDTSGTSTLVFAEGTELAFRRPGNGDLRIEYGTAATDVVIVSGFYSQNLDAQTVVLIGSNPVTVNITPSDITLNNTAVAEVADPGALVGLLGNDDPDGEPITYVIESDPSGLFRIEGDELRTNGPLDFEIQSSYQIDISATDPVGGSVTETFTIDVININEPPSGLSFTSVPVPETAPVFFEVGTITAFDPEGDQLSYQIDGDFGDLFAISGDKVIVTGALDASTPLYQVEITATDRSFNTTSAQFVISITDVDQPPTGLALSAAEVDDGDAAGTVVGTLSATDPEGEAVSFRITDSANGLFSLDGDDLVLAQSVEFDDGAERSVTVLATDPTGNTSTEVFTITVADSDTMTGGSGNDDLPPADLALSSDLVSTSSVVGETVGILSATDPEGGAISFALIDDGDGLVTVEDDRLVVAEVPAISDGTSRTVIVEASDPGGNTTSRAFDLSVTEADGSPPENLLVSGQTVFENVDIGTQIGRFSAIDPEGGDTTYTLLDDAGGRFVLDGNALLTASPINFESASSYDVTVRASDPTGSATQATFTINVINDPDDDSLPGSQGGGAAELIVGERTDDTFILDTGSDRTEPPVGSTVVGSPSDDTLDGLDGTDTVIYSLRREDVVETVLTNNEVRYQIGADEEDLLRSIERVELEDGTYLYGLREEIEFTYRLYSAALARTPDEGGVLFWDNARLGGLSDKALAQAFVDSPEFEANFLGDPSDEAFVEALYQNVLQRTAVGDPGGDFWLNAFQSGELDRADMLIAFANAPENLANNEDNYDDGVWVV
ncbi:MAG: DUF4214 domain-containing protein, partial [Pseudomonadota bacterium]